MTSHAFMEVSTIVYGLAARSAAISAADQSLPSHSDARRAAYARPGSGWPRKLPLPHRFPSRGKGALPVSGSARYASTSGGPAA